MSTEFAIDLVRQHILAAQQFVDLTEAVSADQLPLGAVAIRTNRLTIHQVMKILDLQETRQERFGEIALELGLLDDTDLRYLLGQQLQTRPSMRQKIVELGMLSAEQVRWLFRTFMRRRNREVERHQPPRPKFAETLRRNHSTLVEQID